MTALAGEARIRHELLHVLPIGFDTLHSAGNIGKRPMFIHRQ